MQTTALQKSEPQQQELTRLEPGEFSILQTAIKGVKIKQVDDETLNQTLRYCMLLTGIRANNLPVQEEALVLKNFVRNMLGNYTPAEFRLAFNLAVAGQLECDANHYENFNCNYIANI